MKKLVRVILLNVIVLMVVSNQALSFADPSSLYTTEIPENWVYQAQRSNPHLSVFYGEGDYDLLYFQNLGPISDANVEAFVERTLALYEGPGGLQKFYLDKTPHQVEVAGERGLACVYSYEERSGVTLWEYRIFLILPDQQGFSIALGGRAPWNDQDYPVLTETLSQWRWLF